jgi:hypothetical protein
VANTLRHIATRATYVQCFRAAWAWCATPPAARNAATVRYTKTHRGIWARLAHVVGCSGVGFLPSSCSCSPATSASSLMLIPASNLIASSYLICWFCPNDAQSLWNWSVLNSPKSSKVTSSHYGVSCAASFWRAVSHNCCGWALRDCRERGEGTDNRRSEGGFREVKCAKGARERTRVWN